MNHTLRIVLILSMVLLNVGCDQLAKKIVRRKIEYYDSIAVIKGHLTLTKVENTGAFLSMGDTLPEGLRFVLLSVLPLIALAVALIFIIIKKDLTPLSLVGFSCVVGGGIGNLYDRIIYGSVTDFIHMDFILFQTGIFNLADVSVMLGTFVILIEMYKNRDKRSTPGDVATS